VRKRGPFSSPHREKRGKEAIFDSETGYPRKEDVKTSKYLAENEGERDDDYEKDEREG